MDGTLFDSGIDFLAIRQRLELPRNGLPILDQLQKLSPERRARGIELLHEAEAQGAANGTLIPGASDLLTWLSKAGVRCALVTNNSRRSAEAVLSRHPLPVDLVLTRDDGATKPRPDLFLQALDRLDARSSEAVAVGDTHLDALAAHAAGISKIYLIGLSSSMAALIPADVAYKAASDLGDIRREIDAWLQSRRATAR
jgi:HAD superfamily hydrolase (TIGR01549 family)